MSLKFAKIGLSKVFFYENNLLKFLRLIFISLGIFFIFLFQIRCFKYRHLFSRKTIPNFNDFFLGEDQREARSPSYFNPEEAAIVVQYVQDLLETKDTSKKVCSIRFVGSTD